MYDPDNIEDHEVKLPEDKEIVDWITQCRSEADSAKTERKERNRENYDMFHLRYDFDSKEEGQSTEILSKQSMAVEQNKSFFQQALADLADWWKCQAGTPEAEESLKVRPYEITKLTTELINRAGYFSHVGNCIETAMLSSLCISKIGGRMIEKPKYIARKKGRGSKLTRWIERIDDKIWEPEFRVVPARNYYPDPSGAGLYEIEDCWIDKHLLCEIAEADSDFDYEMIESLQGSSDVEDQSEAARESGQNTTASGFRKKIKLTEYWGTILNKEGDVVARNVQAIIAEDTYLILKPRPNPLWHKRSPYTASPLMEVANSVWHKAPMDAPTMHNRALIEMYNLLVDAGMMQVHAVGQIRSEWLKNPAQVSEGIRPGMTLDINAMCPPGAKVMEPLSAVQIPPEAFNIFNLMNQEFNASALTSDLRAGVTPFREQKATAIQEQSQAITSVFQGMAKNYEARQSQRELELAWMTIAQNWDLIDPELFVSLFGRDRGEELKALSPEEVFADTVNGIKFQVFGITKTLAKTQDFRKYTTLLQTIGASPVFMEAFSAKYDMTKYLGEIMTSLDIDKEKLERPMEEQMTMNGGNPNPDGPAPGGPGQDPNAAPAEPDQMSQVPQPGTGSMAEAMGMQQNQGPAVAAGGGQ
jgi:hypothetical protein